MKKPGYVIKVDKDTNEVVVGDKQDLFANVLYGNKVNCMSVPEFEDGMKLMAKIRYNSPEVPCRVYMTGEDEVRVVFDEPQRAITPGQAVVFYDGDIVAGGLRSFVQQMKICEFYFILSSKKKVMLQYNVLYIKHITGERGSMLNFIRGFCMALADSVPGVSGGTVAFLLGFYDKFIMSLDYLMSGTKEERIEAIKFLIRIGIGWVVGMGAAVSVLASIFDDRIYEISSLFLGLIIFAIPMICKEEKDSLKGKYQNIIWAVIGVVLVAAITYFNPVSGKGISVSVEHLNIALVVYIFAVAMVAISAMVLPGISGSTMLLIFGLYVPVITALKEVMHLHLSYFPVIVIFGLGILTGIALVIKLIRRALENHRSAMIYFVIGMMIGSLYAIVMGPTTLENTKAAMTLHTFHPVFFIIGIVIVFGLEKIKAIAE